MMRKCHLNTCPVGVATQDPVLRKKFAGKPEHVVNYLFMVAEDARQIMAELGFRTIDEMVGRVDCLETNAAIQHWKADGLDLTDLLTPVKKPHADVGTYCTQKQDHGLELSLDRTKLLDLAKPALEHGEQVRAELDDHQHQPHRRHDPQPRDRQAVGRRSACPTARSTSSSPARPAKASARSWPSGVTLELEGDANDYVGKGLSGGRVIIYPPAESSFVAEDNIIIGNVALYGATSGEAFFRGRAAERFAVRNSGANAVIEGVGDHGCEYMTGGRVVDPRPHRPQLRRRHERRHRLRLGSARRVPR